jgi:hypothetical protein
MKTFPREEVLASSHAGTRAQPTPHSPQDAHRDRMYTSLKQAQCMPIHGDNLIRLRREPLTAKRSEYASMRYPP